MTRRDFAGKFRRLGAAALLTVGGLLAGCGDEDEETPTNELVFTTSIEAGHQHVVRLDRSLLETPPAEELVLRTSTEAGHNHAVRVTPAELRLLDDGGTVDKTTTINDGHSHTLVMQRP